MKFSISKDVGICSHCSFVSVCHLVFRMDTLGWVAESFGKAVLPKIGRMKEMQVANCNLARQGSRLPKEAMMFRKYFHCSSKFSNYTKVMSDYS